MARWSDSEGLVSITYRMCPTHSIPIVEDSVCEACHAGLPAAPPLMLTLFSARNKERCVYSFGNLTDREPEWWSNAMAGETGEACNLTKKMSRLTIQSRHTWNKLQDQDINILRQKLMREIGDVVIYADLLCSREGFTLAEAIRTAFNEKSEEIGSTIRV